MVVNKILWHPTRRFHYCITHGDTVTYHLDALDRNVAQCHVCGAKLVVVSDKPERNTETGER